MKILIVLFLIACANLVATVSTVLFFGYRYVWFSQETIPEGRVDTAMIMLCMSFVATLIMGEVIRSRN